MRVIQGAANAAALARITRTIRIALIIEQVAGNVKEG
jgi:hypothetical protein